MQLLQVLSLSFHVKLIGKTNFEDFYSNVNQTIFCLRSKLRERSKNLLGKYTDLKIM